MQLEQRKRNNDGKKFEEDFRKSTPPDVFVHRVKDAGSATQHLAGVRNICDYICYRQPVLYLLELKSHKGKSIPFGKLTPDQIQGMGEHADRPGVKAGFVFNFREIGETYFVEVGDVIEFVCEGKRQSFPADWCERMGRRVDQHLVRTRYRYDVDKLLGELAEIEEVG